MDFDRRNRLRGRCADWWFGTDESAPCRINTRLPQRIEYDSAFDPREAVAFGSTNGAVLMRVAAMQARLEPSIALLDHLFAQDTAAKPELALGRAARENHMRELLDLLTQRLVGRLSYAGGTIRLATGNGYNNVLLSPGTLTKGLFKLVE